MLLVPEIQGPPSAQEEDSATGQAERERERDSALWTEFNNLNPTSVDLEEMKPHPVAQD